MKFNCGDQVYWKATVGKVEIERAGTVVAIVPPNADPHDYIPEGVRCKVRGAPRLRESYLVQIPGVAYAFWPHAPNLVPLTNCKLYVLESQPKRTKHFVIKKVDRSDRLTIIALALQYGDRIIETKQMVEIPAWKRQFWFDTHKGVEYICQERTI